MSRRFAYTNADTIDTAKAVSRMNVFSNMAGEQVIAYGCTILSYLTTGRRIAITRRLAVGKALDGIKGNT